MGISTITGTSVNLHSKQRSSFPSKRKLSSNRTMPTGYLLFSLTCYENLMKILEENGRLPWAIIVDLDEYQIEQFRDVLAKVKANDRLSSIPVIGIAEENWSDTLALISAGLDDCFDGTAKWNVIEKRVRFLSEYKSLQKKEPVGERIQEYKMPLLKRAFDIVASSILLLILSPFFLIAAILIKLESKGPVFYYSKRIGTGYQEFNFIKFRSMRQDADEQLKKLAHLNSYDANNSTFFKIKCDPRVTRVGKVIRKTSFDELPQLFNVLKGDMSIIGNRPLPMYEAEKLTKDSWAKRFLAPAGLTGLWQVDKRGKDNLSTEERVSLDMQYADDYSLTMDIKILLKTLPAMWQRD